MTEFVSNDPVGAASSPRPGVGSKEFFLKVGIWIAVLVVGGVGLVRWLWPTYEVVGDSMRPTLKPGQVVVTTRMFRGLHRGDLVVFAVPDGSSPRPYLQRVIGLEGEELKFHEGTLWVNGAKQTERYAVYDSKLSDIMGPSFKVFGPITVAPGEVFVMGDNRWNVRDSRIFGGVPLKNIRGKAVKIHP